MKKILVFLIIKYQRYISPLFGKKCRFYPSCSEYTKQAIEKYGTLKGCFIGTKRILRCNPFSKGGYDPLKWPGGFYVRIFRKYIWIFIKFYI